MSDIFDPSLAPAGEQKIQWAWAHMPLLQGIYREFSETKPFTGLKIALSVHMESKTACLCRTLAAGGAEMHVTGCNPLSTQDDVAAAVDAGGIQVFARHGADPATYEKHLTDVLACGPQIVIDDGGDLVHLLHTRLQHLIPGILGGCEETTTGVIRLNAMAKNGQLRFPMITVNNARCKYLFDNRYGTGQSVWDGINRTTNLVVAGKTVVVAGYGWCGKGVSMRAKGLGAKVIITEVDPVKAMEAVMDGFTVLPMDQAAPLGDLFITVTGCRDVITERHFLAMRDGAVCCNAGHFNVELDMAYLEAAAVEKIPQRANISGYRLPNGHCISVLAEGRLVNLASGDGHPVEIMDMSFAIQALSAAYLAQNRGIAPGVYPVPEAIDLDVARRKLAAWGIPIDSLTSEQQTYLTSWDV